jgi:hypothetical protein
MKKCPTSLAIKEMQNKSTVRFLLTPVRMAVIKNANNKKYAECKLVQSLWKTVWRILKK